jgi:hypothetical protein
MEMLAKNGEGAAASLYSLASPSFAECPISTAQLAAVSRDIASVTIKSENLRDRYHVVSFSQRPRPNSWSATECFDHLVRTTNAFLPAISAAIAHAPKFRIDRSLRAGVIASLFVRRLEPPYRLRFKVLAPLTPKQQEFEAAWTDFLASQSRLSETVHSATGFAIDRVHIKSPVYGRIRYNVYGAFRILAAHQRRHLWQIEQILRGFDGR